MPEIAEIATVPPCTVRCAQPSHVITPHPPTHTQTTPPPNAPPARLQEETSGADIPAPAAAPRNLLLSRAGTEPRLLKDPPAGLRRTQSDGASSAKSGAGSAKSGAGSAAEGEGKEEKADGHAGRPGEFPLLTLFTFPGGFDFWILHARRAVAFV